MLGDQVVARIRINAFTFYCNNWYGAIKAVATGVRQQVGEGAVLLADRRFKRG